MSKQNFAKHLILVLARKQFITLLENSNGKVGVPILLYFLGVPGIFVVIIWALFFRG